MPPWAKWTLIGCGGCFTLVVLASILGGVGLYQFFRKNFEIMDMSAKPDPPLTAATAQLLPQRVGAFARRKLGRPSPESGAAEAKNAWQGSYVSNGKRVELIVMPTAEAQDTRRRRSPFGNALRQQQSNPGVGVHMSFRVGSQPFDMVVWSKPNWTYMIQSPDMMAEQFALAYQPAVKASGVER